MVEVAPARNVSPEHLLGELHGMAERSRRLLSAALGAADLSDRRLAASLARDVADDLARLEQRLGARLPERLPPREQRIHRSG